MSKEYRKRLFDILNEIEELSEPILSEEVGSAASEKSEQPEENASWKSAEKNCDHKKRYSPEFKKMIVKMHRDEGRTCASITEEYGVSKASITKWCSDVRYENKAKLEETSKELQNMRQEYEKVKEENTFLKKIVILLFGKEMEVLQ